MVGPGCRGNDVDKLLAAQKLFFPVGHCRGVGLGGFLLQGGFGWHGRALGPACENVLAIDYVGADGELRHASPSENADMYWAVPRCGPRLFRGDYPLSFEITPAAESDPAANLPSIRSITSRNSFAGHFGLDPTCRRRSSRCFSCRAASPSPSSSWQPVITWNPFEVVVLRRQLRILVELICPLGFSQLSSVGVPHQSLSRESLPGGEGR